MGKQLSNFWQSLEDQDACEDLVIKFEQPMDDVRIPWYEQKDLSMCDLSYPDTLFRDNSNPNVQPQTDDEFTAGLSHVNLWQKNCSDYKPKKKSQLTRSTIPSKQEVKEDLVKTQKKSFMGGGTTPLGSRESFFNVKDSKHAKLYGNKNFVDERHDRDIYEVNLDMVEHLDKAGLFFAAKDETGKRMEPVEDLTIPMNEQEKYSDYKPKKSQLEGSTAPTKQEWNEYYVKPEKKANFITEAASIFLTVGCLGFIVMLVISVLSDIAASFSTNSGSSSPLFDAKCCRSSTDGQTNSNFSPSSPGKVHQVFFNYRGEQLRYNFVSHLSDAFQRHKIKFFIDKNEQRGKDLKDPFVRIEESSIALAIFSTRYTESSWCMDELVKMKKLADQGMLLVIPIFYKVKAEEVRKPTGDSEFGRNFWRLAEDSSGDQIKEWKEALDSISDKMGLSLGEMRYSESTWCIDELVKMKKLADQGKLLVIPIFYKVKARDVRKPTSDSEFGKNFWRLAEFSSRDQIKKWKEALECICDKMGLSFGDKWYPLLAF